MRSRSGYRLDRRVAGPIPAATVSDALVSNVDLAPTIADFAGASLAADGVSLRRLLTDQASFVRTPSCSSIAESIPAVPTYCGVRTPSFTFVHYTTGEEELYDLVGDPRQLRNVAAARPNKAAHLRALTDRSVSPFRPGSPGEVLVPGGGVVLAETVPDLAADPSDRLQALAGRGVGEALDLRGDQSQAGALVTSRALWPVEDVRVVFAELAGKLHAERDAGDEEEQRSKFHERQPTRPAEGPLLDSRPLFPG